MYYWSKLQTPWSWVQVPPVPFSLIMSYISSNESAFKLSLGILFLVQKDYGLWGMGKNGQENIKIVWSDDDVVAKLATLVAEHPLVYEILPRQYKSEKSIKAAATLSSMDERSMNKTPKTDG